MLWIVAPDGIIGFDYDTRAVRKVRLDEFAETDSIADVTESDGALWVSSSGRLYLLDLATSTVENVALPGGRTCTGYVAADLDYVWFACGDSLWRYDKLGLEWFGFRFGEAGEPRALHSTGDEILCATDRGMSVFSVSDERWRHYGLGGAPIPSRAAFRSDGDVLLLVGENGLWRYRIGSYSWESVAIEGAVADIALADSAYYLATANGVFAVDKGSFVLRKIDVAGVHEATAIAVVDSLLFVAGTDAVTVYDLVNSVSDAVPPAAGLGSRTPLMMAPVGTGIVSRGATALGLYNPAGEVWEYTEMGSGGAGARRFTWDDEGLGVRYGPRSRSVLKGSGGITELPTRTEWVYDSSVATRVVFDSVAGQYESASVVEYDSSSRKLMLYYNEPRVPVDLTLHNESSDGRYLDLFFDNATKKQIPRKGAYYRGANDDNVQSARLGTNEFRIPQSLTMPSVDFEGGNAYVSSRRKLEDRDRRVVRSQVGAGYVVTETRHKVLAYSPDGAYSLGFIQDQSDSGVSLTQDVKIIPGSVRLWVDGEEIDSTVFGANYTLGIVDLSGRMDLADPTSVITVSYQVRAVPDRGIEAVEFVPENHLGGLGYSFVNVSPTPWMSPRVGYVYLGRDSVDHLLNLALPVELRGEGALLKADPELSVNPGSGALAGALSLRSRLANRLSLAFDGRAADTGFVSTDILTRGYGAMRHEMDWGLTWDVRDEIPVTYTQHNRRAVDGSEDRYELSGGARFDRLPFAEVSVSRNMVDAVFADSLSIPADTIDTLAVAEHDSVAVDTIDAVKDKVKVRLWETSAEWARKYLRLHRLTYDISWSLFGPRMFERGPAEGGTLLYGSAGLSPRTDLTFGGSGLYLRSHGAEPSRKTEPVLYFSAFGLPRGVDLTGRHEWTLLRYTASDSSALEIYRSLETTLKPGEWWDWLGWVSLKASVARSLYGTFATYSPRFVDVATGSGRIVKDVLAPRFTLSLAPGSLVLVQSTNAWTMVRTVADTLTFTTSNDASVRLTEGDRWRTRWQYTTQNTGLRRHAASSTYRKKWLTWFDSEQGVKGSYTVTDSLDEGLVGPTVRAEVTTGQVAFLRSLKNTHDISVQWSTDGGAPEVLYDLYVKAVVKPNFSLRFLGGFAWRDGGFDTYSGSLSALALF